MEIGADQHPRDSHPGCRSRPNTSKDESICRLDLLRRSNRRRDLPCLCRIDIGDGPVAGFSRTTAEDARVLRCRELDLPRANTRRDQSVA